MISGRLATASAGSRIGWPTSSRPTRGGLQSTSGVTSAMRLRRRWWAAGTTSSSRGRSPTTRRCGPAGRMARLTIGPWTHAAPAAMAAAVRDGIDWFDTHLGGRPPGPGGRGPAVRDGVWPMGRPPGVASAGGGATVAPPRRRAGSTAPRRPALLPIATATTRWTRRPAPAGRRWTGGMRGRRISAAVRSVPTFSPTRATPFSRT